MSTNKLKEALRNCLISFDRRVQLTDLLQQFKLSYADVNKTLVEHLQQEESKGVKYEKRFLVQGFEADTKTQIFTVVNGENKMRDWLNRLEEAQSTLYSVEVLGGSKSPPVAFKPIEYHAIKLANLEIREEIKKATNGSASTSEAAINVKAEPKQETKKISAMEAFTTKKPKPVEANKSKSTPAEKISPKKEKPTPEKKKTSPEEKKAKVAPNSKKGINNFFAPASTASASASKAAETKKSSPKKMNDFFKKQAEKPAKTAPATKVNKIEESEKPVSTAKKTDESKKTANPNESVQLFNADSDSEIGASSDEEEKLEALRRDIITADVEGENSTTENNNSKSKRRRVISSDEEDEPQQKIEKREDASVEVSETVDITASDEAASQSQSETFLDEEGFLITVKPKKKGVSAAGTSSSAKTNKTSVKKSPPALKSPVKAAAAAKTKSTAAAKTKQGNIMNFFSKK